ncbi:conserved hypothetical protein [Candidatus Terasakiella magnetica]|nr:conserved hypothetical protein [Candidatus Terasakiella magnetica]
MTQGTERGMAPMELGRLLNVLGGYGELAVAVSGGMDSLVLARIAHRHHPCVEMFHAASPAVPRQASVRLEKLAADEGWKLSVIDVGELRSPGYVRNPADRCYYCKSRLYDGIRDHTRAVVASGNNVSDLGDYRPGLRAAAESGAVHPYIEAGIGKDGIRRLAGWFGWRDLSDLPASPCLASRIETGIPISEDALAVIDRVETMIRDRFGCRVVRCRVRGGGISIELGAAFLDALTPERTAEIREALTALVDRLRDVQITAYRQGSAFLRDAK